MRRVLSLMLVIVILCSTFSNFIYGSASNTNAFNYQPVFEAYKKAKANGFEDYHSDLTLNGELCFVMSTHSNIDLFYALVDLNDDGVDEMILSAGSLKNYYDVFTYHNNHCVRLFNYDMGYRSNFKILSDGSITTFESGSAFNADYVNYRLPKGSEELEAVKAFGYERHLNEPYFEYRIISGKTAYSWGNGIDHHISKDEYDSLVNYYYNEDRTEFNWIKADLEENSNGIHTNFNTYFADELVKNYHNIVNADFPVDNIIAAQGHFAINWNAFIMSVKNLTKFKIGSDEKTYYEAVLMDIITNQYSSVDYGRQLEKDAASQLKNLTSFLLGKNVEIADKKLDNARINEMIGALNNKLLADNMQISNDVFNAVISGCDKADEALDRINRYITAKKSINQLLFALKLIKNNCAYKPLSNCVNDILSAMSYSDTELVALFEIEKIGNTIKDSVCNVVLDSLKTVLPFAQIKDILEFADMGSNALYPVSYSSEQFFRLYAYNYIEKEAISAFKAAYSQYLSSNCSVNADCLVSCYFLLTNIYEHEINECTALYKLIYDSGALNNIKTYFAGSNDKYESSKIWVNSFRPILGKLKALKEDSYYHWGIETGLYKKVYVIPIIKGQTAFYKEYTFEAGKTYQMPSTTEFADYLKHLIGKDTVFKGIYFDRECQNQVTGNQFVINENTVLFMNYDLLDTASLKNKLTIKHSARTNNAIKVQWNNVKTATGYQVQISTKDGKKWASTVNCKAGITSYTFKKLAAGNHYKFRVRFYINAADGKNYYSPWSATLNSPTLPTGTTLTKLSPAKKAFSAQWKKAGFTGYQIQYSLKSNFSSAKTVTVKNAKTVKASIKNLNAKKVYYVRIRTYKTISKANYFSIWSKAYKVKTK